MVTLKDMIDVMPTVHSSQGGTGVEVLRLCYSSREVTPGSGSVFFALKGETVDGHQYIEQAREAGAVGIVAETVAPEPCDFPWVQVRDSREALARARAPRILGFENRRPAHSSHQGERKVWQRQRAPHPRTQGSGYCCRHHAQEGACHGWCSGRLHVQSRLHTHAWQLRQGYVLRAREHVRLLDA